MGRGITGKTHFVEKMENLEIKSCYGIYKSKSADNGTGDRSEGDTKKWCSDF